MDDLKDLIIKALISIIPTIIAWINAKSAVLRKIESENIIIKTKIRDLSSGIDNINKQCHSHDAKLDNLSALSSSLSRLSNDNKKILEMNSKDILKLSTISKDHEELKQNYGKIILILEKLISKQKQSYQK